MTPWCNVWDRSAAVGQVRRSLAVETVIHHRREFVLYLLRNIMPLLWSMPSCDVCHTDTVCLSVRRMPVLWWNGWTQDDGVFRTGLAKDSSFSDVAEILRGSPPVNLLNRSVVKQCDFEPSLLWITSVSFLTFISKFFYLLLLLSGMKMFVLPIVTCASSATEKFCLHLGNWVCSDWSDDKVKR